MIWPEEHCTEATPYLDHYIRLLKNCSFLPSSSHTIVAIARTFYTHTKRFYSNKMSHIETPSLQTIRKSRIRWYDFSLNAVINEHVK